MTANHRFVSWSHGVKTQRIVSVLAVLVVLGAAKVPIMDAIENPPTRANIRKYKRFRDCVHGDGDDFRAFPCCRFDAKHHVLANVGVILEGRVRRPKWYPGSSTSPEHHAFPVFGDNSMMIARQSSLRVVVA